MDINVEKNKVMGISKEPSSVQIMIENKQPENVKYFNYLRSNVANDARCTRKMKYRIPVPKSIQEKENSFTSKLGLNLRKKLVKCSI
jgi:hypothetical protein